MSRVYDTPRYEDQTLNKVWLHISLAQSKLNLDSVVNQFGNSRILSKSINSMKHELQQFELIDADEILCKEPDDMVGVDLFDQYYLGDAVNRSGVHNEVRTIAAGKVLHEILSSARNKKVWCDYDASIRITHGYLSGKYVGNLSDKDLKIFNYASGISTDICVLGMAACRLGEQVANVVKRDIKPSSRPSNDWFKMICWNRGMELIRLKSFTPEAVEAHSKLRDLNMNIPIESFEVSKTKACRTINAKKMYRVIGLYIIEYDDSIYILDYSSLDQVHQVSKMWEGFYKYANNYRLTGMGDNVRELTENRLNYLKEWICQSLVYSKYSDKLARSMKQSLALLQNDLHSSAEKLEVNLDLKSKKLIEMIKEVLELPTYWHDAIRSTKLTGRIQLDVANMFYALPAPDCNLKLLFDRAAVYMQQANEASPSDFREFMMYCTAMDFCKAVTIYKKEVKYGKIEGYDFDNEAWYKSCLKGKLKLPSDSDMGKVWVENFFPFNNTIPTWYWEAADVTHVLADATHYDDLKTFSILPRNSHNELLYALDYAPNLSYKWKAHEVLDQLGTGKDKWDRMAVMAVKCENTKPGAKCRETWSADDITREITSCYDRAAIPIAAMYKGVTARKSDIAVQEIFDRICSMTRRDTKEKVIIMSNDVSGWSPLGDREAWSLHHDYLIRMTKAPRNLELRSIWKNISAYISKRGLIATSKLPKGLFQGWTGTCDSIFNVHISLFCVRKAKRAGLLLATEAANTAGLIDDAVQAVELDPESTIEHQQNAADSHFKTTAATWKSLGAELDTVKTIYSSSKFIYLNRFFCEGSEVFTPMKIFARADKEFNRRFATIYSQIDTVFGSYRASVDKGMCPITAYYFAIERSLHIILYANSSILMKDACTMVNAAFATRGLGGWGFPHITAWLTQEAQDRLTMYVTTMCSIIEIVVDPALSEKFNTLLMGTLNQQPKIVGISMLLSDPKSVIVSGLSNPEGEVHRKLKHGMIKKCKSKVFKEALEAGTTPYELKSLEKAIKSCRWDASILELLSQCLPSACSASLVDRAYKNEMVTQLFPFRVKSELSQIIKRGNSHAVMHLIEKSKQFKQDDVKATRSMAYDLAMSCRARFYEANSIEMSNHTIPDYGTCLARQHAGSNPGIIIKSKWPTYSCVEDRQHTRNMYDGMTGKDKSRIPKSISAYTFTGERFRYMTPVQRCVSKAAIVSAYLTANGQHGKAFWDLVMVMWGCKHVVTPPIVTTQIRPGTSTKRLSASQSHLTHSISAFRNVHNSIEVVADPLGAYLSAKSTHIDYMSMVTAARTVGLLTLACYRNGEQPEDLYFGFLEGSIPATEDEKMVVFDENEFQVGLNELSQYARESLHQQVVESMIDIQYSRDENEEYICLGFREEHMGTARMGQEISIAAGYLSNIINCGIIASTAVRKQTAMPRLAGDEIISRPTLKADTRYRQLIKTCPRVQAALCIASETVKELCAGSVKMNIAQAPWSHVAEEYRLTFPGWEQQWTNVVGLLRRYVQDVGMVAARALLGNLPHHIVSHLANLDSRSSEEASYSLAYLYLSSYGRLRTPESYTLNSALGIEHIRRVWKLASQVRLMPSRKWKTRPTKERTFMGEIYQALALACQAYYNKPKMLEVLVKSIYTHLNFHYRLERWDLPEADSRFIACEPLLNPYWVHMRDTICNDISKVGMDAKYIRKELDNIANDIFLINVVKSLPGLTSEPSLVYVAPSKEAIPIPHAGIIQEEEIPEEATEPDAETDIKLLKATQAYMLDGITMAKLVYEGEEEYNYDPDFEVTNDDINEFLAVYHDLEEDILRTQPSDEA